MIIRRNRLLFVKGMRFDVEVDRHNINCANKSNISRIQPSKRSSVNFACVLQARIRTLGKLFQYTTSFDAMQRTIVPVHNIVKSSSKRNHRCDHKLGWPLRMTKKIHHERLNLTRTSQFASYQKSECFSSTIFTQNV